MVDDSRSSLMYLTFLLRKMGFSRVVQGESGTEALKLIKLMVPDMVFLDINMPDIGGVEALEAIKSDPMTRDVAVYMITGDRNAETAQKCMALGSAGVLIKPFDLKALCDMLGMEVSPWERDRRRHDRFCRLVTVRLSYEGGSQLVVVRDLSTGGCQVVSSNPLPMGHTLTITFTVDEESFDVSGHVAHCTDEESTQGLTGMGIEFQGADEEQVSKILSLLESQGKAQGAAE